MGLNVFPMWIVLIWSIKSSFHMPCKTYFVDINMVFVSKWIFPTAISGIPLIAKSLSVR